MIESSEKDGLSEFDVDDVVVRCCKSQNCSPKNQGFTIFKATPMSTSFPHVCLILKSDQNPCRNFYHGWFLWMFIIHTDKPSMQPSWGVGHCSLSVLTPSFQQGTSRVASEKCLALTILRLRSCTVLNSALNDASTNKI